MKSTSLALVVVLAGCASSKQEEKRSDTTPKSSEPTTPKPDDSNKAPDDKNDGPSKCEEARVQFEFNSFQLPPDAKATLETMANCMKAHKIKVTVEGNADERGTEEYNLSLGESRARTVARYLELLGAEHGKMKTVSYGKDSPLCTEHDESCWRQNRRVAVKPPK